MPTLRDLLEDPALGLRAVSASPQALAAPLASAHVSEVANPAPWLQGGELMMTTGMNLSPAHAERYLDDIAAAGAVALGLGLGAELTFQQSPDWLVAAAERAGLPLLEVPQETPFIAVTKAVFARRAEEQHAELAKANDAQRSLTAAASRGGGPVPLLTAFHQATLRWCVVTDPRGRALAAYPADAAERAQRTGVLETELRRLRAAGLRGSAVSSGPWGEVRVAPLGLDTLLGFLLVGGEGPPDVYERTLTATAACLLSLDAERRNAQERADRGARVAAFRRLLVDDPSPEQARALLRSLRVPDPERLQAGAAFCPGGAAAAVDRLALALPTVTAFADPESADEVVVLLGGVAAEAVAAELGEDAWLGVSAPVSAVSGAAALRQARYALGVGRRTGVRVSGAAESGSAALLLSLGEPSALAGFADAVLDPMADVLEQGGALPTLRAFLEANGAWEVAAANLGVHRHTLRHRIRRIEESTGRDLGSSAERMDLLLAFAARDLAAAER